MKIRKFLSLTLSMLLLSSTVVMADPIEQEVSYDKTQAENFLKILPENAALKAKFQVVDGVGPTEAIAVVVPVSENAESTLQCLIGKDIDVKPGQSATVVITAETRKDVLLLPLSVIAGRQGKGMVTVINDGKQIQTEVMLGATDGAYIEILSGVNEGDTISSIPPNLDPRSNL